MTDVTFTNVAVTGCLVKEFDFVKKFIAQNQHLIPKEFRENATVLSKAYWYFHQKKFNQAINQLEGVKFINQSYTLRGKTLLIRCQYEFYLNNRTYHKSLIYGINAFKRMLYRYQETKISIQKAESYLNLLKVLSRLVNNSIRGKTGKSNTKEKEKLLESLNNIVAKAWVQEKVEELYS